MTSRATDPFSFLNLNNPLHKPPITSNSVRQFDADIIAQDAAQTRIIIHARFPKLVQAFLSHKRSRGSQVEKALYGTAETFTWQDEVTRLIGKRPLVFMGPSDHTVLRDGTAPSALMTEEWDRNGTDSQHLNRVLTLDDYLSYDEIMLGSLIGVSSPSYFINNGNRYNAGKPGAPGTFETRGLIIGLVGARFERRGRMDSTFILPFSDQDARLRRVFEDFFGVEKNESAFFDVAMYQARMQVTIEMLLLEADARARAVERKAYTYVVGLGLGVWQYVPEQAVHYIDVFAKVLPRLSLPNISTLEFAWINVPAATQEAVKEAAAAQGIDVIFSKRNPAEKLETDELLVLSYAWDGNAFPGNEYWQGSLSSSGDPAAACMSTISELHNPLINPYTSRIKVLEPQLRSLNTPPTTT